ncbi:uncharacterized protein LOC111604824 isoform X1 [Drosophila hydei]|uniref:Uncharacterized protein LOC111604824 isoform X1 n=2 Tax=Drosophila hydei TaxID=7224 RepID=A0A6J1MP84_DROHY|nr:uncharacterized protein LOC111604824 isoform X1 [Drosophila hydei]
MWMHLCSRAFIAGSNHSIPGVDETLDGSECRAEVFKDYAEKRSLSYADINGGLAQFELQHRVQMPVLRITHNFRAVQRPQLRKVYLYGCPLFPNCVSTTNQNNDFQCPDTSDQIVHKALLADNVNNITKLPGSMDFCTFNVNSEELVPRTDTKKLYVPSDNWRAKRLLEINELAFLALFENHIPNASGLNIDLNVCRCSLCSKRKSAIESTVAKAKQLVDETVQSVCLLHSSAFASHSIKRDPNLYFISLAHLLMVIACLRGLP